MTTDLASALVLGGAFGVGMCLLLSLAPRWAAPSLTRRVGPYIRDVTDPRGLTVDHGGVEVASAFRRWVDATTARMGGAASIQTRLHQAAWPLDAAAFRARQLVWALAGLAAGGVLVVVLVLTGIATPATALAPPVLAVGAAVVCDLHLTRAARTRIALIEEELPTVLEFLALCLSAGEGILDSLRRVGEVGSGQLTGELRVAVLAVGTGSSLTEALTALTRRVDHPAVRRAVDQLVAAIERGAPLAHVLHAQADDAREHAKRGLIERAGRAEITMLVPLVFCLLPLSVLFAIFPAISMLRLGIG